MEAVAFLPDAEAVAITPVLEAETTLSPSSPIEALTTAFESSPGAVAEAVAFCPEAIAPPATGSHGLPV